MITKQDLEQFIKVERTAALVVNTHVRRGERLFVQARDRLTARGISLVASSPVQDPARLPDVVKDLVDRGCKLIIVGGGDGTISSIVDALAYQDAVLGLLPLGTGNSFARTLGLPLSLEGAVEVVVQGKVADIDLGTVNGDYFANVANIGLSAAVARTISRQLKRHFGRCAYWIAGARLFFSFQPFVCRFISREQTLTVRTRHVVVANGRFHGGGLVSPAAHVDNRQLVVFTLGGVSRWHLFKIWSAFLFGLHTRLPRRIIS
jgi:diacylglycerol kinase (ATP)